MTDNPGYPRPAACGEIRAGFCAAASNGRRRCPRGTCFIAEVEDPDELPPRRRP